MSVKSTKSKLTDVQSTINEAGKGVDIYIMDGGIRISHGQFRRKGKARDFRKQYTDEDMGTDLSHGTGVGGVASFHAPWSTIINVKVLGVGGNYERTLEAIHDIIDDHKSFQKDDPDFNFKGSVINMSFGYEYDFAPFHTAFQAAFDAGIPVITSAGNENVPKGTYPCGLDGIVCVGATAQDYHKAGFSNYDKGVTVYAPGHDIWTCGNKSDEHYVNSAGTSFASPAVAGLFAGWISFENIRDDWGKAMERLKLNWQEGKLKDATPNIFAHSGLDHPNKADGSCPWNGPTNCKHGEDDKGPGKLVSLWKCAEFSDTNSSPGSPEENEVDPNNNYPAKGDPVFFEEPTLGGPPAIDPGTPGCPAGCECSSNAILC
jgi:subtilisin family serine protease